jgi:two-component system phosphate regulon response regulator PhoB
MLKRSRSTDLGGLCSYSGVAIDEEKHQVFAGEQEVVLTHKEFELLSLFVRHPRRVFTRNQLLTTIWGYDAEVYSRTVDSHVSTLRKKLGDAGHMIKSIPKIGYKVE